jgi:hypothetical protein
MKGPRQQGHKSKNASLKVIQEWKSVVKDKNNTICAI